VNSIVLTIWLNFLSIFRIALKGEYCHLHPLKRLENIPNPTRSLSSLLIPISTHHGQQKIGNPKSRFHRATPGCQRPTFIQNGPGSSLNTPKK
jgi:hypothetical protein